MDAVSVIVVVRNGARFIGQALDSIAAQTLRPAEVLVVDGASTDDTRAIAAAYDGVTVISQESKGIASAYNEGVARARGELVAFLSHDDLWLPEKLARHVAAMAGRPGLQFTTSLVQHFLEPGCTPPSGFRRELLDAPVPGQIMECLVARKGLFETLGGFDPRFSVGEDTDWFARARDAKVVTRLLPEVLVRKRVHTTNASLNDGQVNAHLLTALRRSVERKRAGEG